MIAGEWGERRRSQSSDCVGVNGLAVSRRTSNELGRKLTIAINELVIYHRNLQPLQSDQPVYEYVLRI